MNFVGEEIVQVIVAELIDFAQGRLDLFKVRTLKRLGKGKIILVDEDDDLDEKGE